MRMNLHEKGEEKNENGMNIHPPNGLKININV